MHWNSGYECYCRLQLFSIVSVHNERINAFFFSIPFQAYCVEFQKVYNNQIKAFMADVKSMMSGRSQEGKKGGFGGGALTGSTKVC